MTAAVSTPVGVPPGFDWLAYLGVIDWDCVEQRGAWSKQPAACSRYRRDLTRGDPLLFQLIYLMHKMRSPDTDDQVSLSDFHIAVMLHAKRWTVRKLRMAEERMAWIAPRGAGKSAVLESLILWATAHGHRDFVPIIGGTEKRAKERLHNVRTELEQNLLLRRDYPELCRPVVDTKDTYQAASGAVISAAGIAAQNLGPQVEGRRPNLIVLDDIEKGEGLYSVSQRDNVLSTVGLAILGMNPNAAVIWTGTTTMYRSLTHDLVRSASGGPVAKWIAETRFKARHFPAILTGPDGSERSLWPQRWPLEELQSMRFAVGGELDRKFAMNYQCNPLRMEGGLWQPHHIVVDREVTWPADWKVKRALWVDPAVTSHGGSDETGMAGASIDVRGRVLLEHAQGFRMDPDGTTRTILSWVRAVQPQTVLVDVTNGGDYIVHAIQPHLPNWVTLVPVRLVKGKDFRFEQVFGDYQRGRVVHAADFPMLVEQLMAFPHGRRDDVADAAVGVIHHLLSEGAR